MPNTIYNIEKNYWGTNITTAKMQKLLSITPSTSSFDWDPVWYLSDDCNSGGGIPDPQRRAADSTYQVGIQYNDFGDYAMAKSVFTSIIYQYPTTEFAQSALYELFFLESMLGEKYNDLKDLYESDPVIVNNPGLAKVASFMANQCNVELKNYSDAIAWYESVIDNPATFNDSIFAIIDLGYTYLLAEADTVKSCPRGRYEEYKPESQPEFVDYRDYLLSLVNRGKSAIPATDSELHPVVIKSVNPNPASESINIQFDILAEGDISFNVRNTLGQSVLAIPEEHLNKGTHFKYINISSIAPGTYVLTISIYGQLSDSHKLIKY
jgi:tetratricopeptide (TPR) repeat protein